MPSVLTTANEPSVESSQPSLWQRIKESYMIPLTSSHSSSYATSPTTTQEHFESSYSGKYNTEASSESKPSSSSSKSISSWLSTYSAFKQISLLLFYFVRSFLFDIGKNWPLATTIAALTIGTSGVLAFWLINSGRLRLGSSSPN